MSAGHAEPVRFIVDKSRTLALARAIDIAAVLEEGRKYGLVVRHGDPAPPGFAMSAARTGSWEAAHPRLTSFLGLLERLVARIPTGGRAPEAAPTTRAPSAGRELLPLGAIDGAAGQRVVVAIALDAMPARPTVFGPSRRGRGATR